MHPLTDLWWHLLINRTDGALRGGRSGWRFDAAELGKPEVSAALEGSLSLGTYAVSETGFSRWLCLDADTESDRDALVRLALDTNPQTHLFELSRRGAHLWWFCPPTFWQTVRSVGQVLGHNYGFEGEIFPKGPGRNGVRLPLTPHPRSGETYPAIDPGSGAILGLSELRRLQREPLPQLQLPEPVRSFDRTWPVEQGDYAELVREVERVTSLRQYAPERAVGRCPFHDDRHPSLSLLGGFWRCWAGCGQGGVHAFRRLVRERGLEVIHNDLHTTQ